MPTDVVRSPSAPPTELFTFSRVAPFLVSDMRALSSGLLVATDASDDPGAGVLTQVGGHWAKELQRHVLANGLWNRLLRPSEEMLRRWETAHTSSLAQT